MVVNVTKRFNDFVYEIPIITSGEVDIPTSRPVIEPQQKTITSCDECDEIFDHNMDGEICPKCCTYDVWWEVLTHRECFYVMEEFITEQGLWEKFSKEYLKERFQEFMETKKEGGE